MSTDERAPDLLQELYSTGLMVGLLVDIELERAGVPTQLFSFLGWVSILQPVTPSRLGLEKASLRRRFATTSGASSSAATSNGWPTRPTAARTTSC